MHKEYNEFKKKIQSNDYTQEEAEYMLKTMVKYCETFRQELKESLDQMNELESELDQAHEKCEELEEELEDMREEFSFVAEKVA